jgi:two-component system copper resistance phosphate regulon response regulator CusR
MSEGGKPMSRVLVVEDELKIRRSLELGLRGEGYEVVTAATGEEGYLYAATQPVDCMVLDILLPERDGLQVRADLRREGKTLPILLLTARDTIDDRVTGLLIRR